MDAGDSFLFSFNLCRIALAVELGVAEVEYDVYSDHGEVENVEEEAEEEDEAVCGICCSGHCDLENLSDNTAGIAQFNEYLEEQTLSFSCSGNVGFTYRQRPLKTETENCKCFKKLAYKMPIHNYVPDLSNIFIISVPIFSTWFRGGIPHRIYLP